MDSHHNQHHYALDESLENNVSLKVLADEIGSRKMMLQRSHKMTHNINYIRNNWTSKCEIGRGKKRVSSSVGSKSKMALSL